MFGEMVHRRDEHRTAEILVVDDDRASADAVADLLRGAGHHARSVHDPRVAIRIAESVRPDVIVLEAVMPFVDGITLCLGLRERVSSAILMLGERADPHDRTLALRVGADDYLTKPFDRNELEARVGALLRRQRCARREPVRRIGSLVIDRRSVRVLHDGRMVQLTPTEFRLLDVLTAQPGRVFTRDDLLEAVFDGRITAPTRAVDVHLGRLRRKLDAASVRGLDLRARRGFGYSARQIPDTEAQKAAPLADRRAPSAA